MSQEAYFGNWMVALAEAAEVAGAPELNTATPDQLRKAWDLVARHTGISLDELCQRIGAQAKAKVANVAQRDAYAPNVVPAELAWRHIVLPLHCSDREIVLGTANPFSQDAKREVEGIASRTVRFEVAEPRVLLERIKQAYGDPPEPGAAGAPKEFARPGGPHVLVVDDEAGARAIARAVLEEGGFRVTLARNGRQAMERLKDGATFDLVSLDYFMEGMNGLRVLQQIRADPKLANVPVIMVTGASDRRIEMSLFEAGADDFIVKPIDAPLFLLRIQAVLRRRTLP